MNAADGEALHEISADVIKCFRETIDVSLESTTVNATRCHQYYTAFAGTSVKVKKVTVQGPSLMH